MSLVESLLLVLFPVDLLLDMAMDAASIPDSLPLPREEVPVVVRRDRPEANWARRSTAASS